MDPEPLSDELPPISEERTSVVLRRVLAGLPNEEVLVGYLVRQLRRRSFGGLLILLAVLGLIPGLSTFTGLAMLVPGAQMAAGMRAPLLPRFIRRRAMSREALRRFGDNAIPWLERMERYVRPRWLAVTLPPMPNVVGVLVIALGLVIILPLPFSNLPPAIALICVSLGLLERDGMMLCVGLAASTAALAIGIVISVIAVKSMLLLW